MRRDNRLIFEKGKEGRIGYTFPSEEIPQIKLEEMLPAEYIREEMADLPDCTEVDVVRHYTNLSSLNHSVDNGFYPLGSCTMKYNPKINESAAAISGLKNLHPISPGLILPIMAFILAPS